MKQLTCEMCGSTDLIKQDGMFICQSCGTKYSVEEAKRMMIEGTVEVKGTVKVDNSVFVAKQLDNARRALQKEDWEEVEKYYNMVEQHQPNCIEAIFFSAFGKVMLSLSSDDIYVRQQKFNVLGNSMSVIDEYYEVTIEDKKEVILKVSEYVIELLGSSFTFTEWKNGYGIVTNTNEGETRVLMANANGAFIDELVSIAQNHNERYINELIIKHCNVAFAVPKVNLNKAVYKNILTDAHNRIKQIDPSYQVPEVQIPQSSSGSCYVATAVYGSYDCPQVWTLRRYRDFILAENVFGRALIRIYYAVSPTIVKLIGKKKWFTRIWRRVLDRKIEKLRETGVADTPYEDRQW